MEAICCPADKELTKCFLDENEGEDMFCEKNQVLQSAHLMGGNDKSKLFYLCLCFITSFIKITIVSLDRFIFHQGTCKPPNVVRLTQNHRLLNPVL